MSALPITITTAGLQALVNAQNTGVSNVVIAAMGVSPNQVAISAATTVIPGEVKRLGGVAGMVTAEDTIYVSASDPTQDTYTVRTVALYLADGTLFAAYSQAAPLVEKAGPSLAVLEASVKLTSPLAGVIQFEGGGWLNPPASETVAGVLRLATVDDAVAGVSHSRAVTPKGLKAATSAMMAAIQATFDQIAQTLAGKANTDHQHVAGDVTSGTFNEARIPSLPQSRIANLIDALAGKSAVGHTHAASDTTSGTFDVGRIPALGMEKITGLASALASRAKITGDTPSAGLIGWAANKLSFSPDGQSWRDVWHTGNFNPDDKANRSNPNFNGAIRHEGSVFEMPGEGSFFGFNMFYNGGWRRRTADRGWAVRHTGDALNVLFIPYGPANGVENETTVLSLNGPNRTAALSGATIWTTSNFNPADKANVIHSHDWSQITGKGDVVLKSATNLGLTGGGVLWTVPNAQSWGDAPTGYSALVTPESAAPPGGGGYTYFMKIGRREYAGGWGGIAVRAGNGKPEVFASSVQTRDDLPVWSRLWSDANLDPSIFARNLQDAEFRDLRTSYKNGQGRLYFADGYTAYLDYKDGKFTLVGGPLEFDGGARSLGATGYARIPGTDLLMQWGVINASIPEGFTHAMLPTAFGGGCLVAMAVPRNTGGVVTADWYMQMAGKYQDRLAFYANRANGGTGSMDGFEWLAIGRINGNPDPAYSNGNGGGGGGGGGQVDPYA